MHYTDAYIHLHKHKILIKEVSYIRVCSLRQIFLKILYHSPSILLDLAAHRDLHLPFSPFCCITKF